MADAFKVAAPVAFALAVLAWFVMIIGTCGLVVLIHVLRDQWRKQ